MDVWSGIYTKIMGKLLDFPFRTILVFFPFNFKLARQDDVLKVRLRMALLKEKKNLSNKWINQNGELYRLWNLNEKRRRSCASVTIAVLSYIHAGSYIHTRIGRYFPARPFGPENSQKYIETTPNPRRWIGGKRMGTSWEAAFPKLCRSTQFFNTASEKYALLSFVYLYLHRLLFVAAFIWETVPQPRNKQNIIEKRAK